jgi:hypothetical protein
VPFLCPGLPDQDGGAKRWAELGSLEDSCPSNALAHPTKMKGPSSRDGCLVKYGVIDEV